MPYGPKPPKPPTVEEPDEGVVMMGLDGDHLKRLALQGHRAPAAELARRSNAESITAFLEDVLTNEELARLSANAFDVLDDAFEAHWATANRDTVEVKAVPSNMNTPGWEKKT